jgi:hypothetical protein
MAYPSNSFPNFVNTVFDLPLPPPGSPSYLSKQCKIYHSSLPIQVQLMICSKNQNGGEIISKGRFVSYRNDDHSRYFLYELWDNNVTLPIHLMTNVTFKIQISTTEHSGNVSHVEFSFEDEIENTVKNISQERVEYLFKPSLDFKNNYNNFIVFENGYCTLKYVPATLVKDMW